MFEEKDFPLCERDIDRINNRFSEQGWITLYEDRVFATLVSDEKMKSAMSDDAWELRPDCVRPFINEDKNTAWGYSRLYNEGVEPIVVLQEEKCHHKKQVRLCEEMVMFYDLRMVKKDGEDYDYVMVDEAGDDVIVAKYEKDSMVVLVKYLKEFAAVKGMNLLVQFDIMNYSEKTLSKAGLVKRDMSFYSDENSVFTYVLNDCLGILPEQKSLGWVRGKVAYRHDVKDIKMLWNSHDQRYEEYVVGMDDNGEEIVSTCDEHQLHNLFTWDGKGIYTLTPVFFKREVLKKYYDDNIKYCVQDGFVCGPTWAMHADTDRNDGLVAVTLVDLGRLPYKEQLYWKGFNIAPTKYAKLSDTTWTRWIEGQPCDTQNSADFIFKGQYAMLNRAWKKRYGWPLFMPLAEGDMFRFETLHVMTSRDNDNEFHALVQSLTLLLIDSLNEKELEKGIDKTSTALNSFMTEKGIADLSKIGSGINKFELFLVSHDKRNDDLIKLWRNIQDLRSKNVAHRKSSHPDKNEKALMSWCGLGRLSQQQVFSSLLVWSIDSMKWLTGELC